MPPPPALSSAFAALPFAAMLLGIALLPLLVPHLWEHPAAPTILVFSCLVPVLLIEAHAGDFRPLGKEILEYIAFIALIAALYVTAGGIYITGNLRGTPLVNVGFLAIGAVTA